MTKYILSILAGFFAVIISFAGYAASAKTKVILAEQSIITGISSTSKVTITSQDIQESISKNTAIETEVIASACMFTTNKNGDFGLTVTADRKFIDGKRFALHNKALGKIGVTLWVHSTKAPAKLQLKPNIKRALKDHSDSNSVGVNCKNQVKFNLKLEVADLRGAKAGTYDFGFNTSTSEHTE
jgi:hypothetical protein